jgi:hypothetical protein
MRKLVVAALASVCLLAVAALAYAQSSANTELEATASLARNNTGTPARPEAETLRLGMDQKTKDGTGQPGTSVRLLFDLPRQVNLRALRRWSSRRRCDSARADQQKSDRVCPRGSRVGSVNVTAKAAGGSITQILRGVVYVIKPRGGSANASQAAAGLGFWITSTSPVAVAQFLPGKVNHRTGVLDTSIPRNLQQPIAGVKSSIERLRASIAGKDPRGGPLVASTGCPRSRRMPLKVTSVNDDGGRVTDTAQIRCRP